jgi:hypothetical protein
MGSVSSPFFEALEHQASRYVVIKTSALLRHNKEHTEKKEAMVVTEGTDGAAAGDGKRCGRG